MGDLLVGDLQHKKSKEIFNTGTKESERSKEKNSNIPNGEDVTHRQSENPAENLGAMVADNISDEELEMSPELSEFKSTLPMAMQGLSVSALRTYYKLKHNVHDASSTDYLRDERSKWIINFKDKLFSTKMDAYKGNDEDAYDTKTFSQVVEELKGHWNIKPGDDYTNFKNAVLDFEAYSNGREMDIEEYSQKYRQTISFINRYIDTHEGAKSLWGKKRLRMAKSLRAKMQYSMDPDKYFLSKFEDLGAIEMKSVRQVSSHVGTAPDFNEMSKEAGAIGISAGKFLTTEIKGTDLTQKTEEGYEYKPVFSTVLSHTTIPDSPIVSSNVDTMYKQVQNQNQLSYKNTKLTKELFTKSVIVSTITQKISDAHNLVNNIRKVKEDTKKRLEEEKNKKAGEVTELIREQEKKTEEYNVIDKKIEEKEKELEIGRRPYKERMEGLQKEIDKYATQKEEYQKKYDSIKNNTKKEDELNSPDYKLNKEIAALEKVGNIPKKATIEDMEKLGKSLTGYKPGRDLDYISKQYEDLKDAPERIAATIEKRRKKLETIDEDIEKIDKELAEKKKKNSDPTEQQKAKEEYEKLKEKVEKNPVATKQRDMIERFKKQKVAEIRRLFTGAEAEAALKKYDNTKVFSSSERREYTRYYDSVVASIKATLEGSRTEYESIVADHNMQAEAINAGLEAQARSIYGLYSDRPIPDYVILFKMEKMVEGTEEIKSTFAYEIPTVDEILKKKTRDGLMKKYQAAPEEDIKQKEEYNASIDEEFENYRENLKQLNSLDFSRFNYQKKDDVDYSLKPLEDRRKKLVHDRVDPQTDLDMYIQSKGEAEKRLERLREEYREEAIKDMNSFVAGNLSEKKKQLEDEKAKVAAEKQKALDEMAEKIKEADDAVKANTEFKESIRKEMDEKVGNTKELREQRIKAYDELRVAKGNLTRAQDELTRLERGDELVAIQTDIVEVHKADYESDLKKLSLMNEALSNFYTASELMDFQPAWDDEADELEEVHNKYLNMFKTGSITFGKEIDDIENRYYMANMKDYILDYCKIKGEKQGIGITEKEAEDFAQSVVKTYNDLNKNIDAA